MLDAALDYAARGWPVFPLNPGGKSPLGRLAPHGLKDATTDADRVRAWWTVEPVANIGLLTGVHFDVLDIDGPDALDRLETWSESNPDGNDVEGPTVATPRGWHCYVEVTGRGNAVNLAGLAGVDWRGRGGYVVAPQSVREDSATWTWITGTPLDLGPDTPIVPAPEWVLSLFNPSKPRGSPATLPRHAGRTGYGAAALERELGRLALATEGTRNQQLNASAHSLGQLVAAEQLDAKEVVVALLAVGRQIGLTDQECERTIESGMRAGIRRPRWVA